MVHGHGKTTEERLSRVEEICEEIPELLELLRDVKGALRLFVKFGKFIKWASGVLLAISGIAWVIRHFGTAP